MPVLPFLLVLLAWGFAAWQLYSKNRAERRRVAAIAAYCKELGWRFSATDPYDLLERWQGPPFDTGRRRRVGNVIIAELGGRVTVACEYAYESRYGERDETLYYSVVALRMPCALPPLHVGPEDAFDRIGTAVLGMEDIDLESEDFNRRFRVRCPNPKFAHDVLTPRTMQALLSLGYVEFRFAGADALCWKPGRLDPSHVLAQARTLQRVLAGVPSFVWRERGVPA